MHSLERIGRYRLERRLGSGAFAVVWLAHDDVLEAPVAIKVLAENWAGRLDVRERFLEEARLLRRAGTSRIVQVYDIGELPDGRPYFVMEYADGGTLADHPALAAGTPLPLPEALRLTALAARAAEALHTAGIVHRDIKPSNVLRHSSPDGRVRLLLADLGLAKSLAQASGLTMAAGSEGYRPPEQAVPGAGIDARADVYGLGALGHHLVTGTVPGPPGEVLRPDRLRPGLDPAVSRALLRALAPDREDRWPTALAFARELERLTDGTEATGGTGTAEATGGTGAADAAAPAHDSAPTAAPVPASASTVAAPLAARRLRRLVLPAVLAALAVVLGGTAAAVLLHRSPPAKDEGLRVTDSSGRVRVEVPADWGGQVRASGWDPAALGLRAGKEPGLAVADDLSRWQDLDTPVNGVFLGLSGHGDVAARVGALGHAGCHYEGGHAWAGGDWHGRVRTWSGCPGEEGSLTEAALTPADGTAHPQLYVQIRESDGGDEADRVLDSVRVAS
ncbi:serine/threonine-protein kinase [Streptomyces sp. ME02-6978a]|uniref:serine/threonine-protein kinase n=1 Tax=unclassified Streptomyces TaxID=2593676 RepID=UPI0029BCB7BF|nr:MULTISPECIES: serine/threonine-protein kinase [unclassified Streptomyces]MDX3089258.1 serine/threonine-protein kinase [Streptomyces sp. ME12-02E]MDX3332609.1 serine/threonine-protein kinase [Streptomyces sp. ME02-6978a]